MFRTSLVLYSTSISPLTLQCYRLSRELPHMRHQASALVSSPSNFFLFDLVGGEQRSTATSATTAAEAVPFDVDIRGLAALALGTCLGSLGDGPAASNARIGRPELLSIIKRRVGFEGYTDALISAVR